MKRKIFILSQWMEIGGVEASLLGLLKELDYAKVEVDLFLTLHQGPWMSEIPAEVNLLPLNPRVECYSSGLQALRKKRRLVSWCITQFARYVAGIYYRILKRQKVDEIGYEQIKYAIWSPFLPHRLSQKTYDLALIFGGAPGFARRITAKTSAVWIHTDWKYFSPILWLARFQFRGLPRIINVGEGAREAFEKVVKLGAQTQSLVVENVLSPTWAKERALRYRIPAFDGLKLLTVGRVSPPKNPPRALETALELKRRGISFKWCFVGGGECLASLRQLHAESGIGGCFEIVGPIENPYPYYPWCDMYICTSDYEGKSVSVREAQMFAKPTIITRFPTSSSQLEEGVDGIIVDCSPMALADAIEALAKDAKRQADLSTACAQRDYANLSEINTIFRWMGSPSPDMIDCAL